MDSLAIKQSIKDELEDSKTSLNNLQNEKKHIEEERKNYIKAIVTGVITREEYETLKQDLDSKEAQIEEQMASLNLSQERIDTITKKVIKLISSGIKAFESSKVVEKNQFLKILKENR